MTNYLKYRGKCKEEASKLSKEKGYRLVRGFYYEAMWSREEQHWWCVDENGIIHDPTRKQFPSGGIPEFYREYDGNFPCSECGKIMKEEEMQMAGAYPVCSYECHRKLVGLL